MLYSSVRFLFGDRETNEKRFLEGLTVRKKLKRE